MFQKTNLYAGLLALLLFSVAQHQGWNFFENSANSTSKSANGSGRSYHK